MRVGKKVVRICAKAKSPRQSQGGGGYAPANRAGDGGYCGSGATERHAPWWEERRPKGGAMGAFLIESQGRLTCGFLGASR